MGSERGHSGELVPTKGAFWNMGPGETGAGDWMKPPGLWGFNKLTDAQAWDVPGIQLMPSEREPPSWSAYCWQKY